MSFCPHTILSLDTRNTFQSLIKKPHDERLHALAKAGFTLCAGINFNIGGERGLVIYYGNPHIDPAKLCNPTNSRFLYRAARVIGAAAAAERPLREVKEYRAEVKKQNWRKVKNAIAAVSWIRQGKFSKSTSHEGGVCTRGTTDGKGECGKEDWGGYLHNLRSGVEEDVVENRIYLMGKAKRWIRKMQGGGAPIPPSISWQQCAWTFFGVIITHSILSRLNFFIQSESDGRLNLQLAPLGAFSTLQYSLTAAPASQPRNAIFSQIFALTVAIALSYIPNVPSWFRSALAPAIVIPGMAKLGITHPPAGAAAIVFASGKYRWEHMGIFMVGVCISIINGVLINNWSDQRQYPTGWPYLKAIKAMLFPDEKKDELSRSLRRNMS